MLASIYRSNCCKPQRWRWPSAEPRLALSHIVSAWQVNYKLRDWLFARQVRHSSLIVLPAACTPRCSQPYLLLHASCAGAPLLRAAPLALALSTMPERSFDHA